MPLAGGPRDAYQLTYDSPIDRPLPARNYVSARLRHRPMRFSLRVLHVGEHDLSAQERVADTGRT